MAGFVQCRQSVLLEVTNEFETAYDYNGRMFVRCYRFRYVGILPSRHLLLKYHNLHADSDDYIHRVYAPTGGGEVFDEHLQRYQFPTFPEVLDELEYLAQRL